MRRQHCDQHGAPQQANTDESDSGAVAAALADEILLPESVARGAIQQAALAILAAGSTQTQSDAVRRSDSGA